ncbi:hypothetical protein GCM10027067_21520 [Pseudactinotalea suaedae]
MRAPREGASERAPGRADVPSRAPVRVRAAAPAGRGPADLSAFFGEEPPRAGGVAVLLMAVTVTQLAPRARQTFRRQARLCR